MCCGEAGEKEKESARAFYFFDYFILMGIPSGSLCGGESFEIIHARPVGEVFRKTPLPTDRAFFIAHNEPSDFPFLILGQISLLGKIFGKSYTLDH